MVGPRLGLLRAATAEAHQNVESRLVLLGPELDRRRYAEYLAALLCVVAPLEGALLRVGGIGRVWPDLIGRSWDAWARRLVEFDRAKDRFIATVSHELRTPLHAIMGWIELLRSGGVDEHRRDHDLTVIQANAQAQAQLVDDLIGMSRMANGKFTLSFEQVRVTQIVEQAIESASPAAQAKEVRLVASLDPRSSCPICSRLSSRRKPNRPLSAKGSDWVCRSAGTSSRRTAARSAQRAPDSIGKSFPTTLRSR